MPRPDKQFLLLELLYLRIYAICDCILFLFVIVYHSQGEGFV
jgi:hypothetical protein